MENQFAEGENRIIRPSSTAVVIFGATGDLTHRKLLPAVYNLAQDDYLPPEFIVVGVARSPMTDEQFRAKVVESLKKFSRREVKPEVWENFGKRVFYQCVEFGNVDHYQALRQRLEKLGQEGNTKYNYLYYLATAPQFFGQIASSMKAAGLIEDPEHGARTTSVVIEKPFGYDLESARHLNRLLRENFAEQQIFRIDHYLGKETVQNILVFRFANGIFEPLWNRNFVDHIQISVCEDLGVGTRAGYFDETGIMRDILQNHLLQMLALLCIEPPTSLSNANSIRDEKVKVLSSIHRMTPESLGSSSVRAQYTKGFISGQEVPGYLEEKGVDPKSKTETYIALKLEIDNWRWAGVPIYVRVGKRLPKRITEITVFFKRAPDSLFRGRQISEIDQNVLAIQVQPNEGISLKVSSKPPGPRMRVRPVVMDFTYGDSFGVALPEAYERLLLDAMKGDPTLFIRDDEIEQSWDVLAPLLQAWKSDTPPPVYSYEAGTWGPQAAATMIKPAGHRWRRL